MKSCIEAAGRRIADLAFEELEAQNAGDLIRLRLLRAKSDRLMSLRAELVSRQPLTLAPYARKQR